jgi:hypothetical protein
MKSCCKEALSEPALPDEEPKNRRGFNTWLKRIGVLGFTFFLLKGIAWLFVFWGGVRVLGC